jgi:hypothetical protein
MRKGKNDGTQPIKSPTTPSSNNHEAVSTAEERVRVQPNPTPIAAQAVLDQSWWDTGDAIRYFGAMMVKCHRGRQFRIESKNFTQDIQPQQGGGWILVILTSRTCVRYTKYSISN